MRDLPAMLLKQGVPMDRVGAAEYRPPDSPGRNRPNKTLT